jgi:NitT/TauT family transport system permease protein
MKSVAIESVQTRPRAPGRFAHRVKRAFAPFATIAVILIVWEWFVRFFDVPSLILPAPTDIVSNIIEKRHLYFVFSIPTLTQILAGFAMAAVLGIALGVIVSFSSLARRTIYPMLVSSQMVPKVAIAPVIVIWFGTGLEAKAFIAFLIAFFPITLSTMVGLAAVDPDMVRLFRAMRAGRYRTFMKLRLPTALPNIFAGLKIGMSLAVVGGIVAEFVAADRGLGYYLLYANGQLDGPGVFGALTLLTLVGVLLYYTVELIERLFIPAGLVKDADPTNASM